MNQLLVSSIAVLMFSIASVSFADHWAAHLNPEGTKTTAVFHAQLR